MQGWVYAQTVHESERTRITRLVVPAGTVIRKEPLGPDAGRRAAQETAMLDRLRGVTGVAQLAREPRYPGSVVLADAGRTSLADTTKPVPADELAGLAMALGRAVAGMHRRGVMHRDIAPANIVLGSDGVPCLVDFALASSVAEIRPEFTPPSEIAGTVAYLAPEATGRTGRAVDPRADLYALGAVLYELATGAPPFGGGDPLRLIHDHRARVPVPPAEVNPAVPVLLSQIILHLLEKEPDNRYQTAESLVYDLEQVQGNHPAAAGARVGEHDAPGRLLPPSRLSGHEDDLSAWLAGVLRGDSTVEAGETVSAERYAGNPVALFLAHLGHANAAAILGDQAGLERHTAAFMPLVAVSSGLYTTAVAYLLRALALAGQTRDADVDQRGELLAELDEVTAWLAARAADAPDNFGHLLRLVEAERAWATGDFRAAVTAFDAARREAAPRQRPWHRALIAEHAAHFYLAHGLDQAAHDLLAQARQEYLAWGATAKVSQLDWAYPVLRAPAGTIDLLGIVSASQALSSETSIDRLHARVAEVLSTMTGATAVHLLLWSEDRHGWLLPAAGAGGGSVSVSDVGQERMAPTSVLRYVQRTREPLAVADVVRDDRFGRDLYFAGIDCCSLLAVPILSRGALRAALLLENRLLSGAFTGRRLDAVNLIAAQLAVSLDNAQLYAGYRQIAGEQAGLRRVATLVARAAPPEEVFAAVTAEAGQLLGVDAALLSRYDPRDTVTVAGSWSSEGSVPPASVGTQLPLGGHNVTTLVFRTGQTARIMNYADVSGVLGDAAARDWGWLAAVGVPVRVEGRLWGVLIVALTRRESLPPDTEKQLAEFTELVATVIANTQARVELQASAQEQAALRRVATLVARSATPEDVFAAVAAEAGQLLGADLALSIRYDPRDTITVLGAWTSNGAPAPLLTGNRFPLGGHNATTLVFQTGRTARVEHADISGVIGDLASQGGWRRTSVGVPIKVEDRLWGVMIVAMTSEELLSADAEARLAGFTELVATAIANAQARTGLRSFADEQAALRRVAELVARSGSPEEVFAAVTAEAGRLHGADLAFLNRYAGDGTGTFVGTWAAPGDAAAAVGTRMALGGQNVTSLVFRTGRSARVDGYADATGPFADFARGAGAQASVGVPVSVAGRLWGVMILSSRSGPLPVDTEARLAGFTELAATAVANAEAHDEVAASRARIVAASDETRRRIERDLHDGVQQRLVTQALMLSSIRDRVPAEVYDDLDELRDELAATRQELRDLCQGVHPAILVEAGLGAAIRALARRSRLPVRPQILIEGRLPHSCEVTAYYVAAEAFTNAAKYAGASAVDIRIEQAGGTLTVQVRDDGAGGADASLGSGLTGLRDRVEAVGGSMTLDSPAGAGTTLTVLLPIPADRP